MQILRFDNLSIRRQASFRDRDANGLFLACTKDFKRDNIAYVHIEHHINDVILTGDLNGAFAYG